MNFRSQIDDSTHLGLTRLLVEQSTLELIAVKSDFITFEDSCFTFK